MKFGTDTFADNSDTLTVEGGRIDVKDSKVDTYDITKLTSSENGKYSIDLDLSTQTADKFLIQKVTIRFKLYFLMTLRKQFMTLVRLKRTGMT